MTLLLVSFLAGMLTVLAPCILPLLPVVVGASATGRSRLTPYIVVGSLALSIILFTFVLKASTVFITVPASVWTYLSGGILVGFGLTLVFPSLWERFPGISRLSRTSNQVLGTGYKKKSWRGDVLIGAALGPIFSTCSPTYFVILATVLPASFWLGTAYLIAYTTGLAIVLLLIAILGERFIAKLTRVSDAHGSFKRGIGFLFVLLGLAIMMGLEKQFETHLIEKGYFDVTKLENKILEKVPEKDIRSGINQPVEAVTEASAWFASTTDIDTAVSCDASTTSTYCTTSPASTGITQRDTVPQKTNTEPVIKNAAAEVYTQPTVPRKPYVEIVNPAGFVNTGGVPVTIGEYIGEKVILVNVMTYSCSNCQATFPFVNSWYEKYAADGLVVIGIHTPEFAFERDIVNVTTAMQKYGITYPVVLDNDYATWNAYGNRYWPRKYLIDINGNIVFDHIGEGAYAETELKILEALKERKEKIGL